MAFDTPETRYVRVDGLNVVPLPPPLPKTNKEGVPIVLGVPRLEIARD